MLILAILSHTPVWVWGLLAALLVLGFSQVRSRRVPPLRLLILPLALMGLGLFSLGPVFVSLPLVGVAWLLALTAVAAAMAARPPRAGVQWLAVERRLLVPGSWLPLGVILAIFSLRYGMGVGQALHPAWRGDLAVQLPAALLFGAISGALLGRSLAWFKLSRAG